MDRNIGQLTSAIVAGNAAAFSSLYRERFDGVYAAVRRATGRDESFCLDVTQDVFMRVIKSMRVLETEEQLGAWLHRVTLTAAYDRLRRERAWHRRHERLARVAPESASANTTPGVPPTGTAPAAAAAPRAADAMTDAERLEWLRAQLAELDEPALFLLEARHRFGWTLERIGRSLGMKPGAVDGRLGRITMGLERKAAEAGHE